MTWLSYFLLFIFGAGLFVAGWWARGGYVTVRERLVEREQVLVRHARREAELLRQQAEEHLKRGREIVEHVENLARSVHNLSESMRAAATAKLEQLKGDHA